MNRMRLGVSAAIIASAILATFALSVPHTRDVAKESPLPVAPTSTPVVAMRDSFKKGLHTISGSVEVPNVCSTVSVSATTSGNASSTGNILVAILIRPDSGICLQVPTKASFQTTILAPAHMPITLTVNGSPATTTSP